MRVTDFWTPTRSTFVATPSVSLGVVVFTLAADAPDQGLGFVLDNAALDHRFDDLAISLRQLRDGLELQAQLVAWPALVFIKDQRIARY